MSQTGLRAFDSTLQVTNTWLNDIRGEMGWEDRQQAYHALRAVLHALRDHLTVEDAAKLSAQLPLLVRGIYYEGWHPAGKPLKLRHQEDFLAPIALAFRDSRDVRPEDVARAVFRVMSRHITEGELQHVALALPRPIRELWPD